MTVGDFIDYIEELAVDNPNILDLDLNGLVINNELEVEIKEAAE